jgi:hypothetical protein
MDIPKELQDRIDSLPPDLRQSFDTLLTVADSPDFDAKWKLYSERSLNGAPDTVIAHAKEMFYTGAAALLACSKDRVIPDSTVAQIGVGVARAKDETLQRVAKSVLSKLASLGILAEGEVVEVQPGESIEDALKRGIAGIEAKHSVKH